MMMTWLAFDFSHDKLCNVDTRLKQQIFIQVLFAKCASAEVPAKSLISKHVTNHHRSGALRHYGQDNNSNREWIKFEYCISTLSATTTRQEFKSTLSAIWVNGGDNVWGTWPVLSSQCWHSWNTDSLNLHRKWPEETSLKTSLKRLRNSPIAWPSLSSPDTSDQPRLILIKRSAKIC